MIYKDTADAKRIPDFMLKYMKNSGKILAGEGEEGVVFHRYLDGSGVCPGDLDQDQNGNSPTARKMLWVKNASEIHVSNEYIEKARVIGKGNACVGIMIALDALEN